MTAKRLATVAVASWLAFLGLLGAAEDAVSGCFDGGCGPGGELLWIATIVLLPVVAGLTVAAVVALLRDARRRRR